MSFGYFLAVRIGFLYLKSITLESLFGTLCGAVGKVLNFNLLYALAYLYVYGNALLNASALDKFLLENNAFLSLVGFYVKPLLLSRKRQQSFDCCQRIS